VNPNVNTSFNVPGLAGMTSAETAGMIILVIFITCAALGMIAIGIASSRQKARRDERRLSYDDLRSIDRQYNRTGNRPISDSGFGANRSSRIVQDPAGYWRTAQSFEAPIGVARVQHREPLRQMVRQRQLAIADRPVSPGTGYRIDPSRSRLLGLEPVYLDDQVPTSPPMYPATPALELAPVPAYAPMSPEEFNSIVPTSPPVPSARHYRPAVAPDHYEPVTYAPIDPTTSFNPLGQEFKPQAAAKVSLGRHAEFVAKGTDTQRATLKAALRDDTRQIPVLDMRDLLMVG
jgi:hypothetical protein